jgi:hypothetical protein
MATWIDLSAHNLALWRVGEDRDGKRRYVLLPIFRDIRHTVPDPESQIGKLFSWDPSAEGYVLDLRYEQERLPARALWLEQFPGALFRDRDNTTIPIHQADAKFPQLFELSVLPIRNPWVWSNQENPERFYANEEQALADGAGPSVLRSAVEVDPRGVRELAFPVESSAVEDSDLAVPMPVDAADDTDENLSGDDALSADQPLPDGAGDTLQNTDVPPVPADDGGETSRGRRMDYGEYIPDARKSAWDGVRSDLDAQKRLLETTGQYDSRAVRTLAGKLRRDVLWGTLQERLARPDVAASPLKQALWIWLYQETPASVRSSYWGGKRKEGIPEKNLWLRVMAYPEILRAIERRIDLLDESLTGTEVAEQFTVLMSGDPSAGEPEDVSYYTDLYPSEPHSSLPDALRKSLSVFPVSMHAYAELLDHPSYSVFSLLGAMKKESPRALRRKAIQSLMDQSLRSPNDEVHEVIVSHLQSAFLTIRPDFVEIHADRDFFSVSQHIREHKEDYFYRNSMRMVGETLGEEAVELLKTGSDEQVEQVLQSYLDARREKISQDFINISTQPESIVSWLAGMVDDAAIDAGRFSKDEEYRESKQGDILLANQSCAVIRRQLIVGHELREAAIAAQMDTKNQTTDDVVQTDPSGEPLAQAMDDSPHEPQFIKWQPGLKPLPPERSDIEGYRTGPETPRGDQDVTEDMLCERFCLRGIQYGNWMTQKDRQEHLNAAYDGLWDIQQLMGIEDPRAIGLPRRNGSGDQRQPLALALGARGRGGRTAAHYEPSLHVINMTKTKGAGSLLHEWTHAADWFVGAELSGGSMIAASGVPGNPVYDHVTTLKRGTDDEESRAELMARVSESAREKVVAMISKAFISKDIQERVCADFKYHFGDIETRKLQAQQGGIATSRSDLDQARLRGEQKGVKIFEEVLPKMVAAVDKLLARLDDAMSAQEDGRPLRINEMSAISKNILVEPVYQWKGPYKMSLNEPAARNWFRELMDLPPFEGDKARQDLDEKIINKGSEVSLNELTEKFWSSRVIGDFWKNMARKMVNDNPYNDAHHELNGNSAFFSNALTLDGKKADVSPYWSAPHELLARSVSSIGYDRLMENGVENTYLTDAVPCRYSSVSYRADPDPQGNERKRFSAEFFEKVVPYLREKAQMAIEEHFMEAMPNEAARNEDESSDGSIARAFVRQTNQL